MKEKKYNFCENSGDWLYKVRAPSVETWNMQIDVVSAVILSFSVQSGDRLRDEGVKTTN